MWPVQAVGGGNPGGAHFLFGLGQGWCVWPGDGQAAEQGGEGYRNDVILLHYCLFCGEVT